MGTKQMKQHWRAMKASSQNVLDFILDNVKIQASPEIALEQH